MTGILVGMLLIFGFGPAVLLFMGCVAVLDWIRIRRGLAPIGDRRTSPELFPESKDCIEDSVYAESPPTEALAA